MHEVSLVSLTQPVREDLKNYSAEELLGYIARVSNPSNQANIDTAPKLLKYCLSKKHWSPFQMVDATMDIKTTRDIGRQILRHRSFEFQEFSQRYAVVDDHSMYYVEDSQLREARLQDTKNRQNSLETDDPDLQVEWNILQTTVLQQAAIAYKRALELGIAKEQARVVLPEGLTPTHMYMKGSLRSWIHYCQLRMGNGTQKEHRLIAEDIFKILRNEFKFLNEFDLYTEAEQKARYELYNTKVTYEDGSTRYKYHGLEFNQQVPDGWKP